MKGKRDKDSRNARSTIQSLFFDIFERDTLKGKWDENIRNPKSCRPKNIILGFKKETLKRKRKQESNIYHPKFIFTSAVPGQVRKTIDRIFPGEMKTNHLFQNFLGKHVCIFGGLPPRPYLSAF